MCDYNLIICKIREVKGTELKRVIIAQKKNYMCHVTLTCQRWSVSYFMFVFVCVYGLEHGKTELLVYVAIF